MSILEEAQKKVDEMLQDHPDVWKRETLFWSWVRGNLRKACWEKHPIKLKYIASKRYKAPLGRKTKKNPTGMVWAARCEKCDKESRTSEYQMQVDHLVDAGSLKSVKDILGFITRLMLITFDDLQLVCKRCHEILTYSSRMGITEEEASKEKLIIAFCKSLPSRELGKYLAREHKFNFRYLKNATQRKEAVRELVYRGKITWEDIK